MPSHTYDVQDYESKSAKALWGQPNREGLPKSRMRSLLNNTLIAATVSTHPAAVAKHRNRHEEKSSLLGFLFGWMFEPQAQGNNIRHPQCKCRSLRDIINDDSTSSPGVRNINTYDEIESASFVVQAKALLEALIEKGAVDVYPTKHPTKTPVIVSSTDLVVHRTKDAMDDEDRRDLERRVNNDVAQSNPLLLCLMQDNMVIVENAYVHETQTEYTKVVVDSTENGSLPKGSSPKGSASLPDRMRQALLTVYERNNVDTREMYGFMALPLVRKDSAVCVTFSSQFYPATAASAPVAKVEVTPSGIPVALYWSPDLGMHLRLVLLRRRAIAAN